MNKQELIKKLEERRTITGNFQGYVVWWKDVKEIFEQLDESEIGHADEAPRYVKNILARLRELPLHDREVWLKAIMSEFEQDFSRAKWREGYEQGKIEGMVEREKVIVPQYVAEYIEFKKKNNFHVYGAMRVIEDHYDKKVPDWFYENNIEKFCLAWLDGYEVEKEKRYLVKVKGVHFTNYLISGNRKDIWFFHSAYEPEHQIIAHTRKELEEAGFGWVFDCPGIEIEEVEE
ncbi:phage protein [Streptococcus pneumoniae]|nr:phage protein [Streptococcus pneumoniae]